MKGKRFLPLIVLAIAVFAGLTGYGEYGLIMDQVRAFPLSSLLLALGMALANYLIRYLRWEYYLRLLNASPPRRVSSLVFTSGLAMSLTPGKIGELAKSFLLRDLARVPVSVTAPAVVMERFTDVLAVALLSTGALLVLPLGAAFAFMGVALLVAMVFLVAWNPSGGMILRLPFLRRWGPSLESSRSSLRVLNAPVPLLVALALSALAWLSEGAALWVVLRGLDLSLPLLEAVPVYAAATLVGAASLLPGGLVGTEGTMVVLLGQAGLSRSGASAATLLVRLCTLWFAFVLGILSLLWLQRVPQQEQDIPTV